LDYNPYRESGLPQTTGDVGGASSRYGLEKGVVTAIYPDLWRVDITPDGGGLLRKALVVGEVLPPVHEDTTQPSHVLFAHIGGRVQDVVCWPLTFRRMYGPETADDTHDRHFYDRNRKIVRVGNITIRITPDDEIYLYDAESGDFCLYDMPNRTMHTIVPHIFMGTDEATRYEYHRGEQVRIVIPKALIGETAVQDADGISYVAHQLVHLVSDILVKATAGAEVHLIAPLIKLTATGSIVLDPPHIYLGNAGATEPVILGNLFKAFLNIFLTLYNGHSHSNVQTGGGFSGPPTVATALMDNATLSTIAKVSE
jgi:hypothetical protein